MLICGRKKNPFFAGWWRQLRRGTMQKVVKGVESEVFRKKTAIEWEASVWCLDYRWVLWEWAAVFFCSKTISSWVHIKGVFNFTTLGDLSVENKLRNNCVIMMIFKLVIRRIYFAKVPTTSHVFPFTYSRESEKLGGRRLSVSVNGCHGEHKSVKKWKEEKNAYDSYQRSNFII